MTIKYLKYFVFIALFLINILVFSKPAKAHYYGVSINFGIPYTFGLTSFYYRPWLYSYYPRYYYPIYHSYYPKVRYPGFTPLQEFRLNQRLSEIVKTKMYLYAIANRQQPPAIEIKPNNDYDIIINPDRHDEKPIHIEEPSKEYKPKDTKVYDNGAVVLNYY